MDDLSTRLTRILTMIPYIQEHPGIRVSELAKYLRCDPETIPADLNAVLLCGVPPYLPNDYIGVSVEQGSIRLSFAEHFRRPVNLTFLEALSLNLALTQIPLGAEGRQAAEKLRRRLQELLPSDAAAEWHKAQRQVHVAAVPSGLQETVRILRQAVEQRRQVQMEYYTASRDDVTKRAVQPYALVEHRGEWYLVAYCLLRKRELPFRVDRIRGLELGKVKFDPPANLDLDRYRRSEMYFATTEDTRVKLRIAPELARWVREEKPKGRMREMRDGSLILFLSVNQPQWIISWVLAHAGKVEVLEPDSLRERVADACREILKSYKTR